MVTNKEVTNMETYRPEAKNEGNKPLLILEDYLNGDILKPNVVQTQNK